MEALDDRRTQVGNTLVLSDRHGLYAFWRGGAEVSCVCDLDGGLVCKFHAARGTYDPAVWEPVPGPGPGNVQDTT